MFRYKDASIAIIFLILGYTIALSTSGENSSQEINQKKSSLNNQWISDDSALINFQFSQVIDQQKGYILPTTTTANVRQVIQKMPEEEVEKYLKRAFPKVDITNIEDKKKLSERLLEELSNNDIKSLTKLNGQLTISTTSKYPIQNKDVEKIYKNQQIFAHYDLKGRFDRSDQVFVKWTNQNTGEILLFTPQNVNKDAEQNWVSYSPTEGWQPGIYNIEYFQFNSDLTPIAKTSYTINQILD
ncbi:MULTISPECIES: hypothetical protein [Acinetobacter]|uniref:Uncharacterized protein n=1 Tax=Acinetobacter indicus TaxID=756892 RepID=A0A6C0Y671_9GAMM|nr:MULTISPECIES: hypothetical protein [Acinetobacter]QIC71751.1 hypothetical protein FSC09_15270 [Acinetobacter indicus]QKQ71659.1 hypothetical protein E5Y90_15630 [Acinetobacter sp. 10FS3-1]